MEIKVTKRNHFTQCWYDGRIGETFPVLKVMDGIPGMYKVDTSSIFDEMHFPWKWAYISKPDAEVVSGTQDSNGIANRTEANLLAASHQ